MILELVALLASTVTIVVLIALDIRGVRRERRATARGGMIDLVGHRSRRRGS